MEEEKKEEKKKDEDTDKKHYTPNSRSSLSAERTSSASKESHREDEDAYELNHAPELLLKRTHVFLAERKTGS